MPAGHSPYGGGGLKQIENYLTLACEKAHVCSVELDELKELLAMIYGGE